MRPVFGFCMAMAFAGTGVEEPVRLGMCTQLMQDR